MPGIPTRDPDLRRLRALRMIEMRIHGKSNVQIAQEFNVSEQTVARTLSWAKKAELVVQAEDRILQNLLPAAEKAIADVFAGTDDEVKAKTALEIFKSTLPAFAKGKSASGGPVAGTESDLGSYIASLRDNAAALDNVIDGTVAGNHALPGGVEGKTQLLIPSTAESVASQGLSVSSEGDGSATKSPGSETDGE